jgi:hypothetical protein
MNNAKDYCYNHHYNEEEISMLFMPTIVNLLELLFYAFRVLDISRKINALGSLRR